jgi:hypothetical protein
VEEVRSAHACNWLTKLKIDWVTKLSSLRMVSKPSGVQSTEVNSEVWVLSKVQCEHSEAPSWGLGRKSVVLNEDEGVSLKTQ